jgi:hypothetical protein
MGDALSKLREKAWAINRELEKAEEAETKSRGCTACGGEIEDGIYRRRVGFSGIPFSEGSMEQTIIVCSECQHKAMELLKAWEE